MSLPVVVVCNINKYVKYVPFISDTMGKFENINFLNIFSHNSTRVMSLSLQVILLQ